MDTSFCLQTSTSEVLDWRQKPVRTAVSYLGLDAVSVFFLKLRSAKAEVGFRRWRDGGVRLACFCRKLEGGFRPWCDCGERLTCLCRKVEGGFRSWRDCRERLTCFCRNDEGGFRLGRGARQTRSGATDETQ